MGTDRLLWSVPDFRITNNQQPTTAPVIPHWFSLNTYLYNPVANLTQRFHPTMVLTQPDRDGAVRGTVHVSIPLWFSLNSIRIYSCRRIFWSFHPTMVLTQQCTISTIGMRGDSFHPTMVLTQRIEGKGHVDLPIPFPSHYGSHSTKSPKRLVSAFACFHPTMVLTQLVRPAVEDETQNQFPSHYGSHSTYTLLKPFKRFVNSFHPTMVLTQPTSWSSSKQRLSGFHPTMVLTQLSDSCRRSSSRSGFHPTMVLTQPCACVGGATHNRLVSIPLWFSLNAKVWRCKRGMVKRFHPTMVLTQHEHDIYGVFHLF